MGSRKMSFNPADATPHICIVGAGISGLRCADILLQQGFQVTMLEGRNRIGGRVSLYFHMTDAPPVKADCFPQICQSDKLGYTVDLYVETIGLRVNWELTCVKWTKLDRKHLPFRCPSCLTLALLACHR